MKLQFSVPSKTFLMGEYLALEGGPTLLLNTPPRFSLFISDENKTNEISAAFDPNSPAAKFVHKYPKIFQQFSLKFFDPYHGQGGFGASSAQFCMVAAFKDYYCRSKTKINDLLKEYQSLAWDGQGYMPSGADIVAQWHGGLTYFYKNKGLINKHIWPFTNLSFLLVHTGNKVVTHEHLKQLKQLTIDGLQNTVLNGINALLKQNSDEFCQAINTYNDQLVARGLVSSTTLNLLKKIKNQKGVVAAKGCGALCSDAILVLINNQFYDQFKHWAELCHLKLIHADHCANEGVTFKLIGINNEKNQVITVDKNDQQIGLEEKVSAHKKAILHRAFSVFIFRKHKRKIEVLLQQRAQDKYHSSGLWSNTCCSHPKPGEDMLLNAQQRLQDEMGINSALHQLGTFQYRADLGNGLTEHEIDHVFIGALVENTIIPDPKEVAAYKWITIRQLEKDISYHPDRYTPWMQQALQLILNQNILKGYLNATK